MNARILFSLLAVQSGTAQAQDLRDLCPTRPGLGTAPCIVDKGHGIVEVGIGGWMLETDASSRTDTILLGDLLVRYGLDGLSEVQLSWTAVGHVRERDKTTGELKTANRTGDVSVAYKRSLKNPDGSGFSIAIQPFVTLPTGHAPVGSGDWGAGALMPMSLDVGDALQLQLTPEVDASVDQDGRGRHLTYGCVLGLGIDLTDRFNTTLELSAFHDEDPAGQATELLASASFAWQPSDHLALDAGVVIGLNRESPDGQLYIGVSRRF